MSEQRKSSGRSSRRSSGPIILDTSVLYANADRSDAFHRVCRRLLADRSRWMLVPTFIAAETAYLLGIRLGPVAESSFLASLAAAELLVDHPTQSDLLRMAQLVWKYRDLPLGSSDASIVAMAERLGVTTIATLDRRDFSVVKPRHIGVFDLVP